MKYKDLIEKRIEEVLGKKRFFADDFLTKIIDFFEGKINDVLLDDLVKALLSDDNLMKMTKGSRFAYVIMRGLNVHIWNAQMIVDTLAMLNLSEDQLMEMINYDISDINDSNIIDNMIRYLIIEYPQLLNYKTGMSGLKNKDFEVPEMILYGSIPVCACTLDLSESYLNNVNDSLIVDDVFTRDSLRGLKLGERLFKEIFKEMTSKFPDRTLMGVRLMASNKGGQRFYRRLGATLFDLETLEELDEVGEEYGKNNIGFYYTVETIKEHANREIELPTMEGELKRVSSK